MHKIILAILLALLVACATSKIDLVNQTASAKAFGDASAIACLPTASSEVNVYNDKTELTASGSCATARGGRLSLSAQAIWAALMAYLGGL